MRNLDFHHFVVNYSKDDRDDVPHFLLSISYGADVEKSVSPSARQIIAPQVLCWYLSTYCNYEFSRFVPVEINVIYKMKFGSNELKFCFFTSMASTGSAMLVVSGAMGTYFVTGNFCFSNELFKLDAMNNLKQFGEIDRLYIDATLYDVKADLKTIDNICYTMASIIFDTPKSQKVVIMSKPGLEFILVRVMLIMEEKKHLELCHVGTHTYKLIERMGHGRLFTNCVKKGADAKVYVDSNLTEIRRNFGVFHDFVMIKLVPRRIWDADVKSHIKGKHAHVFMILPHSTKEQCERLIWELKPKACFQILSKPPAEEFLFPHQNNGRVSPCDLQMDPYSSNSLTTQNPKVLTNQVSSLKTKQSSTKRVNVPKKTLPTKSKLQKIPVSAINDIRSLPSTSKVQSYVNHISDLPTTSKVQSYVNHVSDLPTTSKLDSSVDHLNDQLTTSKVKSEDNLIKDSIIITSHNLITLPKKLAKIKKGRNDNQLINQLPNALEASNSTAGSDQIFKNDLILLEPDTIKLEPHLQETEEDPLLLDAESLDTTDKSLTESKIVDDSTTKVLAKPSSKSGWNLKQVVKTSPINDSCVQFQTKNVNGEQDVCKNKKPDSYQIRVIDKQLLTVSRLIKIKSPNQKINSKPKTKDISTKNQGGGCARTISGQFEIKSKIQKISPKKINKKPTSNISFVEQKCLSLVPNRIQTKTKVQNVSTIDSSKLIFKKNSDASLIVPGCVEIESTNMNTHSSVRPKKILTRDKSIPTVPLCSQTDHLTTDANGRHDVKKSHEITPKVIDTDKPVDSNLHDVRLTSSTSEKLQSTEDCSLTLSENIALTKITNTIEPENAKFILKKGQTKYNQSKFRIRDVQIESTHSTNNSGEFNSLIKNGELNKFNTIDESTPMILDHVQIDSGLQNNLNQNQQPLLISLAGDKHSPLIAPINPTIRSGNLKGESKPALKKRKVSVPRSLNTSHCVAIEPNNLNTQQIARPIKNVTIDKSIQINNRTAKTTIKKNLKRSHPGDEITKKNCEIQPTDNNAVLKPTTSAAFLASENCKILSETIVPTNQRTTVVAIDNFNSKNSDTTGDNGKIELKKCHSVDITPKVLGNEHIVLYKNSSPILAENLQIKPATSNIDAAKNAKPSLKKIYPTDKNPPMLLYRVHIEHDFQNKSNGKNHPLILRLGGDKFSPQVSRLIPIKPPIRNKISEQKLKPVSKLKKTNDPSSQIDCGSVKFETNNINTILPKLIYQELRSSERSLANAVSSSILSENIVLTNQRSAIDENDNVTQFQNNTDKYKQPSIQANGKMSPLFFATTLCVPKIKNGYSKNASQSVLNLNSVSGPNCQIVSDNVEIEPKNLNIHSSNQPKTDDTRDELIPLDTLSSLIDNNKSMEAKVQPIVKESYSGEEKAPKVPKKANDFFSNKNYLIALNNNAKKNDNTFKKIDPIDKSTPMILESVQIEPGFQNNTDKCKQPLLISHNGDNCFLLVSSPTLCKPQFRNGYSKKATHTAITPNNFSGSSCQVASNNAEIDPEHLKIHYSPQPRNDETRDKPNPLVALGTQIDNRMMDENAERIVKNNHSSDKIAPILSEVKQANDSFSDENNQILFNNDSNRKDNTHTLKKIDPTDESTAMILDCDKIKPGLRNNSEKSQQPLLISPVGRKHSPQLSSQMQVKRPYHENSEIASQPISKRIKFSDSSCQVASNNVEIDPEHLKIQYSPQQRKDKTHDESNPLVALDTQIDNIMIDENAQQIVKNSDKIGPILPEVRQANDTFSDENHQIPMIHDANKNDKTHAMNKIDSIDESCTMILECDKITRLQTNSVNSQQPLLISPADDKDCPLVDSQIQVKPSYHENSEITSQPIIKRKKFSDPSSCQIVSDYVENEPKNLSRKSCPQSKKDETRDKPNSLVALDTQNDNRTIDENAQQMVNNIHSSDKIVSILSEVKQANDSFPDENNQNSFIYNKKKNIEEKIDPIDESTTMILECDKVKTKIINYLGKCQQPFLISLADEQHFPLVASQIHVQPSIRNEPNSNSQPKKDYTSDNPTPIVTLDTQIESRTTYENDKNDLKKYDCANELPPKMSETKLNENLPLILDQSIQIKPVIPNNYDDKNTNHPFKEVDPIDENTSIVHSMSNSTGDKSVSLSITHNQNKNNEINKNDEHDLKKCHSGDEIHPQISKTQVNENFDNINNSKIYEKVNKNLVPILDEYIQIKPTNPNNYEDINAKHPLMEIDPIVDSTSISTIPKNDYIEDIAIPIVTGYENKSNNKNDKHDVKKCQPGDKIPQKVFEPAFKDIQIKPNANQLMKDIDHVHESLSIVLDNEIDNNLKKCHSSDEIHPKISNDNLPPILDETIQIKPTNSNNYEGRKINHYLKEIDPIDESTSISTHINKNKSTSIISLDNANENIEHDIRETHPGNEISINVYKDIKIKSTTTNNSIVMQLNKCNSLQVNKDCTSIKTVIDETPTLSDSENDFFNGFIPEDIKQVLPFQNYSFFSQNNKKVPITHLIDNLPLKKPYKCMLSSLSPVNQPIYLKMIIGKLGLDAFESILPANKTSVLYSIKKRPLKINKLYKRKKKISCGRFGTRTIIEPHLNYIVDHNKITTDCTTFNSNIENKPNANEKSNSSPYPSNETSAGRIITHINNSELTVDEPVEDPKICEDNDETKKYKTSCGKLNGTENIKNENQELKNTKTRIFSEPKDANIVKGSILDSIDKKSLPNIKTERNGNKSVTLRVNKAYNIRKNKTSYGRFSTRTEPHLNKDYIVDHNKKTTGCTTDSNIENKSNANEINNSSLYRSNETSAGRIITHIKNSELNVLEYPKICEDNDETKKYKTSCGDINGTENIKNENEEHKDTKAHIFSEPKDANIVKGSILDSIDKKSLPNIKTERNENKSVTLSVNKAYNIRKNKTSYGRIITHIKNSGLNVDEPVEDPKICEDNDETKKFKTSCGDINGTESIKNENEEHKDTKAHIFSEPKDANIVKGSILDSIDKKSLPNIKTERNENKSVTLSVNKAYNIRKNKTSYDRIITHIKNSELNVDEPVEYPKICEDNDETKKYKTSCGDINGTENIKNENEELKDTKTRIFSEPKDANIVKESILDSIDKKSLSNIKTERNGNKSVTLSVNKAYNIRKNKTSAGRMITHIKNAGLNVDEPVEDPKICEDNDETKKCKTSCGDINGTESIKNENEEHKDTKAHIFSEPKDANIVKGSILDSIDKKSLPNIKTERNENKRVTLSVNKAYNIRKNKTSYGRIITHIKNSGLNVDEPVEDPKICEDNDETKKCKTSCGDINGTESIKNENEEHKDTKAHIFSEPKDANIVKGSILDSIDKKSLPNIKTERNENKSVTLSVNKAYNIRKNKTSYGRIITHIKNSGLNVDEPVEDPKICEDNDETKKCKTSCGDINGTESIKNENEEHKDTKAHIFSEPKDANIVKESILDSIDKKSLPNIKTERNENKSVTLSVNKAYNIRKNKTSYGRIITHVKNSELNVDEPVEDPKICEDNDETKKFKTSCGDINGTENIKNENEELKDTKTRIFSEPKDANIVKGSILDNIDKKSLPKIKTKRNGNKSITLRVNKAYNIRKNKTSYGRFGTRKITEPHRNKDYIVNYKTNTRNKRNANKEHNSSSYNKTTIDRKVKRIKNTVNEPVDVPKNSKDVNKKSKTACVHTNETETMKKVKSTKACTVSKPKNVNKVSFEAENSFKISNNDGSNKKICGTFNLPKDIYFKISSNKRKINKKYKLNTKLKLDNLQIQNLNQDRTYNLLLPKKFQSVLSQEDAVSKICLSPQVILKKNYSPCINTRKLTRNAIFA